MGKILPDTVFMKKFLVLLAAFGLTVSCSMDDGYNKFDIEFLPAISVEAPEYVTRGQTSYFKIYYRRPNDCYYVSGFDYTTEGNIRNVAIQSLIVQNADCLSLENTEPESINMPFVCPPTYDTQIYVFRFYRGTNVETNQDDYLEIEVPVAQ